MKNAIDKLNEAKTLIEQALALFEAEMKTEHEKQKARIEQGLPYHYYRANTLDDARPQMRQEITKLAHMVDYLTHASDNADCHDKRIAEEEAQK